jgi:23S rRNA (cytosine1962-C5)-methyltransferase
MSVEEALGKLKSESREFNLIICDPPSSSSDGGKVTSAIKAYRDLLIQMDTVLAKKGVMVIFLNTHQTTTHKFERVILDYLKELNLKYKVGLKLGLDQDCPTMKGFPEGSYLKGLVLEKL